MFLSPSLNKKGEVVWKHSGYSPGDEENLAEVVEEVAAGREPVINSMKKALIVGAIALFSIPIFGQRQQTFGGQLHGISDGQLYLRDENIDPSGEFYRTAFLRTGYANFIYSDGNFSSGLRYENYQKCVLGFQKDIEEKGLPTASYNSSKTALILQ